MTAPPPPAEVVGETLLDEDWYAAELTDRSWRGCVFREVDLTETATTGCRFTDCTFDRCRFNASGHRQTAFVACTFTDTSLFDATLEGCRLDGTSFAGCDLRPITVTGGAWWGVSLRGADLREQDLAGLRLTEADLTEADLRKADLTTVTSPVPCCARPAWRRRTCAGPRSSGRTSPTPSCAVPGSTWPGRWRSPSRWGRGSTPERPTSGPSGVRLVRL